MVFSKRVLNGNTTTREDFSVTISKDSKVQFYYINMSNNNKEADEKLYRMILPVQMIIRTIQNKDL